MSLVSLHVAHYAELLRQKNEQREAKRREEWGRIIERHFDIIMKRLGIPLCQEIGLVIPGYKKEYNYDFHCTIFDLPCVLTVFRPSHSRKPDESARIEFNMEVSGCKISSALLPDDTVGHPLYILREKIVKVRGPNALQARVWYPYYYYVITYTALAQDEDGVAYPDFFTSNALDATPNTEGYYRVLNPRMFSSSSGPEILLLRYTHVTSVERKLATKPDRRRDSTKLIKDEVSGKAFKILVPIEGVKRA